MSVVVAYSPSEQGHAALRAGALEAARRSVAVVIASYGHVDANGSRASADAGAIRREFAELGHPDEADALTIRESDSADVAGFVIRVAEESQADLLVIGLRGRSPVGKLSLGTAARRVVLASPCPVLAVKESVPTA